jgi:integrase
MLKRIIEGTDIPQGLHCHSLRHSFASLVIAGGTDAATAASLLGHSSPTTTLEIYTHAFAEQQAKAMQAVNFAIAGDD